MSETASEKRGTSPWVWVGCGCAAIVVLAALAIGGLIWWGGSKARQFEAEMRDPAARAARVDSILHLSEMPAGYYPAGGVSIPFLIDVAMLSDREPEVGSAGDRRHRLFHQRGFVYVVLPGWGPHRRLDDFFNGSSAAPDELGRAGLTVERQDVIGRGGFQLGDADLQYVTQRGTIHVEAQTMAGLTAMVLVRCPSGGRERLGIWFGPDPHPQASVAEADFAGTPADPAEIRRFMGHFTPCAK